MSTLRTWTNYDEVRTRILLIRNRWRAVLLLEGLLAVGVVGMTAVLMIALVDGLIHLPVAGRLVLLGISTAATAVAVFWRLVLPSLRRLNDEEVARHIESAVPEIRNGLINAVQLAGDEGAPSAELVDRAITETAVEGLRHDFRVAVSTKLLQYLGLAAAALAVALFLFTLMFPERLTNALWRVFDPTNRDLPVVGSVRITRMEPDESPITVVYGDPLEIKAWFDAPDASKVRGRVVLEYQGGEVTEDFMKRPNGETNLYAYRVQSVEMPMTYVVRLDDTSSARFRVVVLQRPFVESIDLAYVYPKYTGLGEKQRFTSEKGNIKVPAGTTVRVWSQISRPVIAGEIRLTGETHTTPTLRLGGGNLVDGVMQSRHVRGEIYVHKSDSYSFHLVDPNDRGSSEIGRHHIECIPDRKPVVGVIAPPRDTGASPGDTVNLAVRASDDYGLAKLTLFLRRNDETPVELKTWTRFDNPKTDTLRYALELPKATYKVGEVLTVYATVKDNCDYYDPVKRANAGLTHAVTSKPRVITLRDRAADAKKTTEDVRSWRERLEEILRVQQKARAAASTFDPAMARGEFVLRSSAVAADQLTVYKKTEAVVADMAKLEGRFARVATRTLAILSRNEMVRARKLAGVIARMQAFNTLAESRDDLLATQDKIIATLKQVLDILPDIEKEELGEEDAVDDTEMPQDARKKWKDLAEKLKEFADEQKKIIAESQDLAKKPVDDFTKEDEDKLKELAAVEDEWSKFMKELHKDLSKLPNQDFSNPSLLKELLEVQSDVEKAADALTRKEVEIAVPLEQAGAENAEEMTTHIEKWLPDSADRDQWKMEEPTEELETPMAELPKELEDIVGDLMEEEEDLFEEVEDASSAWTDSIDKGAGWDAMDGPISNMSAQGVTGNRLPNSSEIGGRSGEGRTGKSGGEMVEEEATGKGGRRTPTRLTPDPYESGEVKDSAKEPAGGSTGGGKVSGASKEGLEGPVPPPLARKMQRLAGKQAGIRNRAERVKLAFKVLNYGATDFDKLVEDMKGIEDDLKNYRYQNVLRKKRIMLKGLQTARLLLANRISVGRDYTATLPPEVQKEIMDTAEQLLPPEYRELVRKYYESLSEK